MGRCRSASPRHRLTQHAASNCSISTRCQERSRSDGYAARLAHLLDLRETRDPAMSSQVRKASYSLSNVVTYLNSNAESLIDYHTWQCAGGRISTGFVESSINRIVGRRMCKSQHMRWSRVGAHSVVQLRVALLNQEFHELARRQFPWIGQRRVTWPWQRTSQPF
jgi:hypothetical protein